MCRWFAYLSEEPALLEDVLITPKHALTKQVHDHYLPGLVHHEPHEAPGEERAQQKEVELRNFYFNIDGFGVAWYTSTLSEFTEGITGPRPVVYKTVAPALTDPVFLSLCANTASPVIFAHIRAASSPPVIETNNHPFEFGRHVFMHNGSVANFAKIRHTVCSKIHPAVLARVQGTTDSEHVAALYISHLSPQDTESAFSLEQMRDAMCAAVKDVQDAQREVLSKEELENSANSLNLCTTDGQQLVALRYRNHPVQQPPSLYYSTTAGVTLNRKFPGDWRDEVFTDHHLIGDEEGKHSAHFIIASEPSTYQKKEWHLIPKNEIVLVDKNINVKLEPVQI